jgi:hypothetical protein
MHLPVDMLAHVHTYNLPFLKRVSGKFDANLYGMHLPVAEILKNSY